MDGRFYVYKVRGKGLSIEVEEIVTHFIVTCDDEASITEDKSMTYTKGLSIAVVFVLEVRGGNIITCAQKITKSRSC